MKLISTGLDLLLKKKRKGTNLLLPQTQSTVWRGFILNLAKDLVLNRPGKLWCADITYIRILTGFVYLAVIIDAFSRKIVGYAILQTLASKLPLEALKMAIKGRNTGNLIQRAPIREFSTAPMSMWTYLKPMRLKSAWQLQQVPMIMPP